MVLTLTQMMRCLCTTIHGKYKIKMETTRYNTNRNDIDNGNFTSTIVITIERYDSGDRKYNVKRITALAEKKQ